jgi:hypothetical protein
MCSQLLCVSVITHIQRSLYLPRSSDIDPFSSRPFSTELHSFKVCKQSEIKKTSKPMYTVAEQNKEFRPDVLV